MARDLIIANHREVYARLDTRQPAATRAMWRQAGFDVSQVALAWQGDDKTVVLSQPPSAWLLGHLSATLGYRDLEVLAPRAPGDSLCRDLIADEALLAALVARARAATPPRVGLYGATAEAAALRVALEARGATLAWPELPAPDAAWVAAHYGSKLGFRDLFAALEAPTRALRIGLPPGFSCDGPDGVTGVVAGLLAQGRGCVVKGNRGLAGFETLMLDGVDRAGALAALGERLASWSASSYVVEERVAVAPGHPLAYPSIDAVIEPGGRTRLRPLTAMRIDAGGMFQGVALGALDLPGDQAERIRGYAMAVGALLAGHGYVGHFDLDFIVARDGTLFVNEANLRRTGATHVLDLHDRLGLDERCLLFSRQGGPALAGLAAARFHALVDQRAYRASAREGLIVVASQSIEQGRGGFGLVSVAADHAGAEAQQRDLVAALDAG